MAWGYGVDGELGDDTFGPSSNLPVRVCAVAALGLCPPAHFVTGVTMISAGGHHDLAFP